MSGKVCIVVTMWMLLGVFQRADAEPSARETTAKKDNHCDLHMWYMDRVTDGAFDGDLTNDQLRVKKRIETLIARTRGTPHAGRVACSILNTFDNILLPLGSVQRHGGDRNGDKTDTRDGGHGSSPEAENVKEAKVKRKTDKEDRKPLDKTRNVSSMDGGNKESSDKPYEGEMLDRSRSSSRTDQGQGEPSEGRVEERTGNGSRTDDSGRELSDKTMKDKTEDDAIKNNGDQKSSHTGTEEKTYDDKKTNQGENDSSDKADKDETGDSPESGSVQDKSQAVEKSGDEEKDTEASKSMSKETEDEDKQDAGSKTEDGTQKAVDDTEDSKISREDASRTASKGSAEEKTHKADLDKNSETVSENDKKGESDKILDGPSSAHEGSGDKDMAQIAAEIKKQEDDPATEMEDKTGTGISTDELTSSHKDSKGENDGTGDATLHGDHRDSDGNTQSTEHTKTGEEANRDKDEVDIQKADSKDSRDKEESKDDTESENKDSNKEQKVRDKEKEYRNENENSNKESSSHNKNSTGDRQTSHTSTETATKIDPCPFTIAQVCQTGRPRSRWSEYLFTPFIPPLNKLHSPPPLDILAKCKFPKCSGPKRKRKSRSRKSCYYYRILDTTKTVTGSAGNPESISLARVIHNSCNLSSECSWQCFYGTERLQCVNHYDIEPSHPQPGPSINQTLGADNADDDVFREAEASDQTEDSRQGEDNERKLQEEEKKDSEGRYDDTDLETNDNVESNSVHTVDDKDTSTTGESQEENSDKDMGGKRANSVPDEEAPKQELKEETYDQESDGESSKQTQSPGDNDLPKEENEHQASNDDRRDNHKDIKKSPDTNTGIENDNRKKRNENQNSNSQTAGLSEDDLLRIETIFQQKTTEQASKIQNLEILIMKLENQILNQKLGEQNGTSHLIHLENQILRIENELLKLNQSYAVLQAENEMLKARQKKHLALEHKSNQRDIRLALPSNSSAYFSLVTVQQEKISLLSELLKNQTAALQKVQSQSEKLEEQNQMLYQIVMNQTALISHVMHKLQEVSEQNLKNQQETSQLKSTLELQSASSNIIDKLEHMLQATPAAAGNVNKDASQLPFPSNRERTFSHVLQFLPHMPSYISKVQDSKCQHGKRLRLCMYFSFVLSPCSPFRTLSWEKCPYFIGEVSEQGREKDSVKDDRDILNEKGGFSGVSAETLNADTRVMDVKTTVDGAQTDEPHRLQQNDVSTDKTRHQSGEDDAPDSVDIPSVKSSSADTQSSPKVSDQGKNKRPVHSEMNPGPVKVRDGQDRGREERQEEENEAAGEGSEGSKTDRGQDMTRESQDRHVKGEHKQQANRNSAEDVKRKKEEANKVQKIQQEKLEAALLQKRIQEADNRFLAYWSADDRKPKDCYDLYQRAQGQARNGAYKIFVKGLSLYVSVYCDMKAGGWTVLMKREDGSLDFYRSWADYTEGFGTPFSEYYLGNEVMHYLTNQAHYSLQVDLKDWKGHTRYASYQHFWLEDELNKFKLHVLGYSGTAGDGLGKHDGMNFSTMDQDNDLLAKEQMGGSCARRFHGAGWYYKCYMSNLMGMHYEQGQVPEKRFDGIAWKPWTGPSYSLKEVVLKVRPKGAS